jgi:biotin operon repressor
LPQNNSYEIVERRQNIIRLLGQGFNGSEISRELAVNRDQIYKDIKAIKKQGSSFLKGINNKELGYFYNILLTNLFHSNKILWQMINEKSEAKSLTDSDKIKALKTINDITINLRETVTQGLNLFEIPELKDRLNKLESINNNDNNRSYFISDKIQELPYNNNQIEQ